jgi:hypothetical protein
LGGGILRIGGIFLVLASEIPARVVISHRLDQLEWIGLMRGREPSHLHIEFAFIQRERALQDSVGDRARDFAAVPRRALYHHCDDILRMVKWRETRKPRHVFLLSTLSGLRSASLPRYHPIFQTCSAAGTAVFINNLPQPFADQLDVVRGDFLP